MSGFVLEDDDFANIAEALSSAAEAPPPAMAERLVAEGGDGESLDMDLLRQSLAQIMLADAECDVQQWKDAFGESAEVTDAISSPLEDDEGFEVVGTF